MADRRRLILVDDEPVIVNLLTSVFEDEPWEIAVCADGASAIAAMDAAPFDVLLTDKNLPDRSGLDLVRHARAVQPGAESILITGYASLETALAAIELEVFDYIVKPPRDIFEVRRKVRQAFERAALTRENARLLAELRTRNDALEVALEELRRVQAELVQSEKLAGIGTLAAGVAHEISSPLFGAMGLAEAILDEEDPALVKDYAREIVDYSKSIRDIVVQLSSYSRAAEAGLDAPIELARCLDDAARLVTRTVGFDPAHLSIACPPDLRVHAHANELQQVFVNLFKNATEAVLERHGAGGDGRVRVAAGVDEPRSGRAASVWVRIADNGPGIKDELQKLIFDPFFTTKPPGRGTGLGLNIVYRILTKYRATVAVESALGVGTTFVVRFPVDSPPPAD